MAAAGSARRVIRAITKHRAIRRTLGAALADGALLVEAQAAWIARKDFMIEMDALSDDESRIVLIYLGQDDAERAETWAALHKRLTARHGGR